MNDETYAYFTVVGSGDHNLITEILGVQPTKAFTEGEPIPGRNATYGATRWCIESDLERNSPLHECLDDHIGNVLSKVEPLKDKLASLKANYDVYIQCVAYYHGCNLGCDISSSNISRLSQLDLGVEFDLYALPEEDA